MSSSSISVRRKPRMAYRDKDICVTGEIKEYRSAPDLVASDAKQIKIQGQSQ